METDFFRDLNLKTTWTVELFWTILKCFEFFCQELGHSWNYPELPHLPYLPMPSGPACDHLHLLSLASADWGGPGNMKQGQKLHDRHASHKTNHTTTRNTREPKATLLVHCWCLLVSSGLFWCLCSLTLGLICMACLASWHLHNIPMDFITS